MTFEVNYTLARNLLENRIKSLIDGKKASFPEYEKIRGVRESPIDKRNYMGGWVERNINILMVISPQDVRKSGDTLLQRLWNKCAGYMRTLEEEDRANLAEYAESMRR